MRAFLVLLLLHVITIGHAQDERYFRKLFTGELLRPKKKPQVPKVEVSSKRYQIDLNRDGLSESLVTKKKDGTDHLVILDYKGATILDQALTTMGSGSKLYKARHVTLSSQTDALILYFYEGATQSVRFEATARLYFLTVDKRDLKTLSLYQGPHYFHEKEKLYKQYLKRGYSVNVIDYDGDGKKEVSISYNKISRVFKYLENGRWARL